MKVGTIRGVYPAFYSQSSVRSKGHYFNSQTWKSALNDLKCDCPNDNLGQSKEFSIIKKRAHRSLFCLPIFDFSHHIVPPMTVETMEATDSNCNNILLRNNHIVTISLFRVHNIKLVCKPNSKFFVVFLQKIKHSP